MKRTAFTLIELLVVIAILMALLLPAVQKHRDLYQLLGCRNDGRVLTEDF